MHNLNLPGFCPSVNAICDVFFRTLENVSDVRVYIIVPYRRRSFNCKRFNTVHLTNYLKLYSVTIFSLPVVTSLKYSYKQMPRKEPETL